MSVYTSIPLDRLKATYEDLQQFAKSERAKDRASARVALHPIVKELNARGVEAFVPEWTAADIAQYKREVGASMNDSVRYFVTQECSCPDSPQEHEVSKADFVRAERRAGFRNAQGQPYEPATSGFSSTKHGESISGRIEYVKEQR